MNADGSNALALTVRHNDVGEFSCGTPGTPADATSHSRQPG